MVYCCVGGCTNAQGKTSAYRHFLRFYPFPKKDTAQMKKWIARVNRRPCDLNTSTMMVCSDHFADADFEASKFLESRLCYKEKMKIVLKKDSVPNTNRANGEKCDHKKVNTESAEGSQNSTRKKARYHPTEAAIDSVIRENDEVLKNLNAFSTENNPGTSEQPHMLHDTGTGTDFTYEERNSKSIQCSVKTKSAACQTDSR